MNINKQQMNPDDWPRLLGLVEQKHGWQHQQDAQSTAGLFSTNHGGGEA